MFFFGFVIFWSAVAIVGFAPRVLDPLSRRLAKGNPLLGVPTEVEVTDSKVHWRGRTQWAAEWSAFRQVRRSDSMILLYFGPQAALTIPMRAVERSAAAELDSLIAAHVGGKKRDSVAAPAPRSTTAAQPNDVVVRYTLRAADWRVAMAILFRRQNWFRLMSVVFPLLGVFSFCGVALEIFQGREVNSAANWIGASFFLVPTALFRWWFPSLMGVLAYRQNWLRGEIIATISEAGIHTDNAYGAADFPWATFSAWSMTASVIGIFLHGQTLLIPRRALAKEAESRLVALLERKVGTAGRD